VKAYEINKNNNSKAEGNMKNTRSFSSLGSGSRQFDVDVISDNLIKPPGQGGNAATLPTP